MPEEINRKITDHISDILFTSFEEANNNLEKEGIKQNVHFVGNIMIDNLIQNLDRINNSQILENLNLKKGGYFVMTLHRPSNVDSKETLSTRACKRLSLSTTSFPPETLKILMGEESTKD